MSFINRNLKYKIIVFTILALSVLAVHYLFRLEIFNPWKNFRPLISRLTMSIFLILCIILIGEILSAIINGEKEIEGERYNLLRITRLLTVIFVFIVFASFMFQNLYAAAVSFGLISLVLGFALQAPITSFISWLYIVFRKPYKVGQRIQINGMRGDVVEIGYLDTIILECNGDYLENDRRSGRKIYFPNSLILKEEVINYSGAEIPFIWNETPIQIAYISDLPFVEKCLLEAAEEDFKERFPTIDIEKHLEWIPEVYFRVNTYAWLEAVISYPVEPEDTTGRRNRILRRALPKLNAQPEKVLFPEGSKR